MARCIVCKVDVVSLYVNMTVTFVDASENLHSQLQVMYTRSLFHVNGDCELTIVKGKCSGAALALQTKRKPLKAPLLAPSIAMRQQPLEGTQALKPSSSTMEQR